MAYDLYDKASLKQDLLELVDANPQLSKLYMNIAKHILYYESRGKELNPNPEGIKISNISLQSDGFCEIQITY